MGFQKATKKQAKLRLAIFGPSGAGKTFTALRMAKGIGGKIAFIDSEKGSASKYADRFDFDVCDLQKKSIDEYIKWIKEASKLGYSVLIIDSITHAWQELLEEIDQLAKTKYKGNTWSAWSEGTPKQKLLIDAILDFNGHVIATMRSKTEWSVENGSNGKTKPVRVGLAPEQGKGIEYEFDLLMEITTDHIANIIKDRTGKFQDVIITKPGEEFGAELKAWLESGESMPAATPQAPQEPAKEPEKKSRSGKKPPKEEAQQETEQQKKLKVLHTVGTKLYNNDWDKKRKELSLSVSKNRTDSSKDLTVEELDRIINGMNKKLDEIQAIAEQHKKMAQNSGAKGSVDTQKALFDELKRKIEKVDNGIDFTAVLTKEQGVIDLVTDPEMSAELTLVINKKAKELGVNLAA